jgi:hypothetical protein
MVKQMDDRDHELSLLLKNWVAGNPPPAGGRWRLLKSASAVGRENLWRVNVGWYRSQSPAPAVTHATECFPFSFIPTTDWVFEMAGNKFRLNH